MSRYVDIPKVKAPPIVQPEITSKYQNPCLIGEGTYGKVFRVEHAGRFYAQKVTPFGSEEVAWQPQALREATLLQSLDHENIVKIYEVALGRSELIMVLEYCDCDLKRYIDAHAGRGFPAGLAQKFLKQILSGLEYCHADDIIHRDLKPPNILVRSSDETLKLADFGLARPVGLPFRSLQQMMVTRWYRAPDLLLGGTQYTGSAISLVH
eukprot:TRINITY_DN26682_c0_g1_i5.p1 TRINITY_DN26682_c0_g1~~TRINITY_DN26682_c0_g1_i5.p1  ORF type:complete len:209 (+),score=35.12 TRINITY_DN26682_c0_g1_i5:172-798(+)